MIGPDGATRKYAYSDKNQWDSGDAKVQYRRPYLQIETLPLNADYGANCTRRSLMLVATGKHVAWREISSRDCASE